jgi:hypothetical protein
MRPLQRSRLRVRPALLIAAAILVGTAAPSARSQEISSTTNETAAVEEFRPAEAKDLRWHIELKRQFTDKGTVEEQSKSTVRLESTPNSFIARIRLDLQFVDKKNGDPATPQLGDTKLRFGFHSLAIGGSRLAPFIETTFPTADPESAGNGKYQLSPGAELYVPLRVFDRHGQLESWKIGSKILIQQVVSVAGDAARKDINYTRFEPELLAAWKKKLTLSLTPKFVFDWHQQEETGFMLELEGDWFFNRNWWIGVVLGKGIWNTDVPTGYGSKVEFSVRFNF